ncbi:MAG TPA: shikimate kinase, partial [Blastocatellia bacterium]|nr:shikimate kinase [Blastocatellia bacterium]
MRIAIFGNSGSGKSTLARRYVERYGLPLLELDDIVWEPGKIAVLRPESDIVSDLDAFVSR